VCPFVSYLCIHMLILRRFRRWRRCWQWPHPCDILTLFPMFYKPVASSLSWTGTNHYVHFWITTILNASILPVERPPGSATPVLPSLNECLHHFEAKSRWDLLLLLSGWVNAPGLKCRPWQTANAPPGSAKPGLHSSHHRYLLAADVVQSRDELR